MDPRQGSFSSTSDLGFIISQYKELGAKGFGELGSQLYADDPMMQNLFKYCVELDMPVLVHIAPWYGGTYGIVDEAGLPRLERMLKQFPDLKLIGHSATFWCEISADVPVTERGGYPQGRIKKEGKLPFLMREYGNLYCDISAGSGKNALMRDPEYASRFLTEFADRIYYGGDVSTMPTTADGFPYNYLAFQSSLSRMAGLVKRLMKKLCIKTPQSF